MFSFEEISMNYFQEACNVTKEQLETGNINTSRSKKGAFFVGIHQIFVQSSLCFGLIFVLGIHHGSLR